MCEENEVPHSRGHFSARLWRPVLWTQIKIDHESSPSVSLRESRANETRSPAASRLNLVGDFHARSCFARFTIPEGKWGTNRSQNKEARPVTVLPLCVCRFQNKVMSLIKSWLIYDKPTWLCCEKVSLRSRPLEVAGERENRRARGRLARGEGACLLLTRPSFLVPTTSKRLLRRLRKSGH